MASNSNIRLAYSNGSTISQKAADKASENRFLEACAYILMIDEGYSPRDKICQLDSLLPKRERKR
jgi:hypothetical protein